MSNLAQTLSLQKLTKSSSALVKHITASKEFMFVRVPLQKISLSASTHKNNASCIIVDANTTKQGRTVGGFIPKVRIESGHNLVAELKANGECFANVWVGTSAIKKLNIQADDAISSNELQSKLQRLLQKNYGNKAPNNDAPYSGGVWILEIYPFENYVIYQLQDNKYKQAYVLDPVSREVALEGNSTKVFESFTEVPKGATTTEGAKAEKVANIIQSAAAIPVMPSGRGAQYYTTTLSQEAEYDTVNTAGQPLGLHVGTGIVAPDVIINYGAPSSEYANPPIKTMTQIEEALRMYLSMIADGTHTPLPSMTIPGNITASRYPNEFTEATIAATASGVDINVKDFISWQNRQLSAEAKTKRKGGKDLPASAFAYVGDKDDPSTWHLPVHDEAHVKNALARVNQTHGIPDDKKAGVLSKIRDKASKMGVDVSDKPTKKQKAWKADAEVATTVQAGGPGSGRKPGWGDKTPRKDILDNYHSQLKSKGFKYASSHQSGTNKKETVHEYKSTAGGKNGGGNAHIIEHSTSSTGHRGMYDSGLSNFPTKLALVDLHSAGNPNSGKKKFAIGDRVKTKHGKGRVTDNNPSKDHVEVTHLKGKVAILHKDEVTKLK